MQTIVLERETTQNPWGFRLKGGSEYNVPLSILKVFKYLSIFYS
jgi:hypothetical protein